MKLPIYIKVLDIRRMRWALKLKYKFIKISDKLWYPGHVRMQVNFIHLWRVGVQCTLDRF